MAERKYLLEFGELGGIAAIQHWKKHRPKMYAELVKQGRLEEAAYNAQEQTGEMFADLISRGMPYFTVLESVRENWIYLPDEEKMPTLGEMRDPPDDDLETSEYWGTAEE